MKRGKRVSVLCRGCPNVFQALAIAVRAGKGKFCSIECYRRHRSVNKMPPLERQKVHNRKHKYGLSEHDWNEMLLRQDNMCALCREAFTGQRIMVDHCHKTGCVRGLLCIQCNTMLGMAKDDKLILMKAVNYLASGVL